jgi:hypothetical protein
VSSFLFAQPTTRLVENSGSPKPIISTGELKHIYRHLLLKPKNIVQVFFTKTVVFTPHQIPFAEKKLMLFQQKCLSIVLTVFYFPHLATLDHIWLSDDYDKRLLGSAR